MLPKAVVALSLSLCIFLWSGPFAHAGGGVGDQNTLIYNPFDGRAVREIRIRELELEALQAEVEAAKAQEWAAKMEVYWASYNVAVSIFMLSVFPPAAVGEVVMTEAGRTLATDGLKWLLAD